jgi:hypothetical protein
MPLVKFKVKCNAAWYSLEVDNKDVELANGEGSMELAKGDHTLTWRMMGAAGSKYSVIGKDGETAVVTVENKTIPQGDGEAADYVEFKVA